MDYLKVPNVKSEWILNTPERREILNEGPPKHAKCNVLGKGAFGTVFKAIFRDRPVALKIVRNRIGVNRTENESHILGWKHRNIVRIFKIESTINFGIIIMEHFPGRSLQLILDGMELHLMHRVMICLDILNALRYCHKQDLLHLDIKPQNVLVAFPKWNVKKPISEDKKIHPLRNRSYICKICDFGSSIKINGQQMEKINKGGTVRYMSPEALRAEILTPAADVYSLAITMWQLQQRRAPYETIQCNEIVAFQVVKNDLRPNCNLGRFEKKIRDLNSWHSQKCDVCSCQYFITDILSALKKKSHLDISQMKSLQLRSSYSAGKDPMNHRSPLQISPDIRFVRTRKMPRPSAVRDLNKDLDFNSNFKEGNKENPEDLEDTELSCIFPNDFQIENSVLKQKELNYKDLYERSWEAKPEKRPLGLDLQRELMELLS